MQTAGTAKAPARSGAGRLQTIAVIAVTAIVIGALAFFVGGGTGGDGVTKVDLKGAVAGEPPKVGSIPPNFTAKTWDGKTVSLADYAGKPIWLTFGASWCPDCRTEAADVEATYLKYQPKGLNLLAVFISEPASDVQGYAQRAGLTFPIAVDTNTLIASTYRTLGIPTHFFIGADGTIKQVVIGALHADDMDRDVAAIMN
jgi:cytochrome c biogenesis protein CcmG, thiol:disulfide interchange protein DsbE